MTNFEQFKLMDIDQMADYLRGFICDSIVECNGGNKAVSCHDCVKAWLEQEGDIVESETLNRNAATAEADNTQGNMQDASAIITQNSNDMKRLATAIDVSRSAHLGQTDKCGQPYWIHPFTVAMNLFQNDPTHISCCIVALLHDILEDTDCSLDSLRKLVELTDEEAAALLILTREPNDSYDEYITKIINSQSYIALLVKIYDLMHNLDTNRFAQAGIDMTEKDKKRMDKYGEAFSRLVEKFRSED